MSQQQIHVRRNERPMARRLNFLLVDDDHICLFIHRRLLELTGYCNSTRIAHHGKDAMDILNQGAGRRELMPDIILLDLEMPTMGGLAFLEAFRKLDRESTERIAIVLVSSTARASDKQQALSLGVVECLAKPLTRESLEPVIDLIWNRKFQQNDNCPI